MTAVSALYTPELPRTHFSIMTLFTPSTLAANAGTGALASAVHWLEATLLGSVATSVAVIAVASVGFMMLTGRVQYRRGLTVVAGCFVLFGAPAIAAGLRSAAQGVGLAAPPREPVAVRAEAPPAVPLPPPVPPVRPPGYDPYSGAAVPAQR